MNSEIIQNVAYDNYDHFQHDDFIFPQNFISLYFFERAQTDKSSPLSIMPNLIAILW